MNTLDLFVVNPDPISICFIDNVIKHCDPSVIAQPIITSVPIPSSLLLYVSGLIIFKLFRRKR